MSPRLYSGRMRNAVRTGVLALLASVAPGCTSTLAWVAMPFVYEEAELPASQVVHDIPYLRAPAEKNHLDLFLPPLEPESWSWPVLVFVHGGGWVRGDRALRVGGRDVYGNIGRWFAARGVGVAVVGYRLIPDVDWREQLEDVSRAVAWVHANIARYGGNPDALYLSGHSAGAQLVTRLALDSERIAELGVPRDSICGIVPVSGAAYDLEDQRSYELGSSRRYYEKRFGGSEGWMHEASPLRYAGPDAPRALILYGGDEPDDLKRQSQLLHDALRHHGVPSRLLVVPGEDHLRMVLALSRSEGTAAQQVLEFVREPVCRGSRPRPRLLRDEP